MEGIFLGRTPYPVDGARGRFSSVRVAFGRSFPLFHGYDEERRVEPTFLHAGEVDLAATGLEEVADRIDMGVHSEHPGVSLPDLAHRCRRDAVGPAPDRKRAYCKEKSRRDDTVAHLSLMYIKFRRFVSKKILRQLVK